MKTITVRGLDSFLAEKLKQRAKEEGKSVNQLIIDTLKEYFSMNKRAKYTNQYHDMDHLFGKWTEEDYKRIQGKIKSARTIDRELWK